MVVLLVLWDGCSGGLVGCVFRGQVGEIVGCEVLHIRKLAVTDAGSLVDSEECINARARRVLVVQLW